MYMTMDIPIIESKVMKNYMDQKYMYQSHVNIESSDSRIYKIIPINHLALTAFHEYYESDNRFYTCSYVNELIEKLYYFDINDVIFGNLIES